MLSHLAAGFLDEQGLILTNAHVVEDSADSMFIFAVKRSRRQ